MEVIHVFVEAGSGHWSTCVRFSLEQEQREQSGEVE